MSDARLDEPMARAQAGYYTIELAPLMDGNLFVSVRATVPKGEDDIASPRHPFAHCFGASEGSRILAISLEGSYRN